MVFIPNKAFLLLLLYCPGQYDIFPVRKWGRENPKEHDMKKFLISMALLCVSCVGNAMQERDAQTRELLEPLKLLVAKYVGNSRLSEEVVESYRVCLSRRQHGETLQEQLKLERSNVELLRSLYEYTAFSLESECLEDTQIVVAHRGEPSCTSCKSEKNRAEKLDEFFKALKGQQETIQKLLAIEYAQRLLTLQPVEKMLQKVQENQCAVENDLKACPALKCEKR